MFPEGERNPGRTEAEPARLDGARPRTQAVTASGSNLRMGASIDMSEADG